MERPEKEAREIQEYGAQREGYWDNAKFMQQFGGAEQIARVKYPSDRFRILWLFNQSSGHTAMAADALVASCRNG